VLQQTFDKLNQMKLFVTGLSFEERLGMLVDRKADLRENKRLARRLKEARLKQQTCVEGVDFRHPRGLDRSVSWPVPLSPAGFWTGWRTIPTKWS